MKGKSQPIRSHPLIGVWGNPFFSAQWTVSVPNSDEKLIVKGVDRDTGTEFNISMLSWTSLTLNFRSVYPPTNRVVFHECRCISQRKMKDVLTYEVREVWIRSSSQKNGSKKLEIPSYRSKLAQMTGTWHNPAGEDFRTLCTITFEKRRLRIHVEDIGDGEQLQVREVTQKGKVLSFKTKMLSTGQICHRTLELVSPEKIRVTLKFREAFIFDRES